MNSQFLAPVDKLATDIPGFDLVTLGGLPRGRTTLVAGTAGSAKTVFAAQFLAEGILHSQEAGVFVTFEEPPDDLRRNMASFGWPIADWERQGLWRFVDGSIQAHDDDHVVGQYDLGGLLVRIEHAVTSVNARRVSLDSLGAIFNRLHDGDTVRHELLRISVALKRMNVTSVLTAERTSEYGDISRHGVEEFVADNVVILRNALEDEKRRRTIEVLKYRGTLHQKGEFPFSVTPARGVTVIPLSAIELKQRSSNLRVTSGNPDLDGLCGGGFFRDSVVLVSGATGTGKTLLTTEFLAGGVNSNERCLLLAFEESREQLFRNAIGWGVNFEEMEAEGKLKVYCVYPETASLEDHLITIKDLVAEFRPHRVAVDSLSALERVGTIRSFREFVIGMTSFIKHQEITGLFTATTPTLTGGASVTESHISTLTDSIILLRYVEINGEMRRGITVLKMRGSMHNKDICEFTIDGCGLHVGKPFRNVVGILSGNPHMIAASEIERLDELFRNP
ncbi:MAG: circadian clock protein KaiC [Caldilinea sp.]|nr:circadian clock protein KaiC [Caldilinea sp.]MCB0055620.1 circadian clock protein KaiC [Caldilineaceae bacterium]MCB0039400.1 circadian clock protein KaiC [Caldilinea sp.]MCB0134337.1 circadian clock protein KaiC [Caldilineaceae bacterium]MCB0148988.1 circadian clock protein KaiC [Caldilineaceae bacterium]